VTTVPRSGKNTSDGKPTQAARSCHEVSRSGWGRIWATPGYAVTLAPPIQLSVGGYAANREAAYMRGKFDNRPDARQIR
jgi:hypothetical protein